MNVNEIDNMYKKILIHNLDAVFASRYLKNSKSYDDTLVTFIGNKIFTFIGNYFYSLGISDILYTFVIAKTKIVKKINIKNNDFRFCVELPIKLKRSKAKLGEINSTEKPRLAGKKKVNALKDGFLILTELIRLFFNKKEN